MNNQNPFVPQGSLLELQGKRRSRMKLAVFCVLAVGITGLVAMLIQGCKREEAQPETPPTAMMDTNLPTVDTNLPTVEASNPPVTVPPVSVAPPPVAPVATGSEYVVVKGDTLATIAKAHGISTKSLEAANPGVVPTKLKIGQKLVIPASTSAVSAPTAAGTAPTMDASGAQTYKVKSGDTLSKIAKELGVGLKSLEAANPTVDPAHIKVGQVLKVPAKAETAPAPAMAPAPSVPAPVTPPPVPAPTTPTNGQ